MARPDARPDARSDDRLRDKLVVLIGGSGFFGRHLAQELLARGARLRIASRNVERGFALKTLGNLGQVQLVRLDVTGKMRGAGSLAAAVAGAHGVINLVGAFAGDLDAVQGRGAGAIAAAAAAAGAKAFVHISAIGADAESTIGYAQSKGVGEAAVLAAFPGATVLRPSILFGPDDHFVNMFAGLAGALPVLPVFGPEAKLQPLFVDDAAIAAGNALADPRAHGRRIYEIAGPEVLTMLDINRRIAAAAGRKPVLVPLPDPVSALIAGATGWLPGAPITRAQWLLLKAGNIASGALPGIADLGVEPRPLELFLVRWLMRFRVQGRFGAQAKAG